MNNLRRIIHKSMQRRSFHFSPTLLDNTLYEPPYLELMKSKVPMYDTLNIQMKGYDFAVLESYQKFVHRLLKNLDVSVEEAWATPHQDIQVTTFKHKSEIVNAQYGLKIYERNLQITDVVSTQLPLVLRALETSAPAGVTVQVLPHTEWDEEVRYVPDTDLISLKNELEELGGPTKKKP